MPVFLCWPRLRLQAPRIDALLRWQIRRSPWPQSDLPRLVSQHSLSLFPSVSLIYSCCYCQVIRARLLLCHRTPPLALALNPSCGTLLIAHLLVNGATHSPARPPGSASEVALSVAIRPASLQVRHCPRLPASAFIGWSSCYQTRARGNRCLPRAICG
jgi:hypothetical protein